MELVGYVDAAFGDDEGSGRSSCGYVFTLGGSAVSWASKRQPIVALSTTEAEYIGGTLAAKEAIWLRGLLVDLGIQQQQPTTLYNDNMGSIALAHTDEYRARTKHINIRYHFIRSCVQNGIIDYKYLETAEIPADTLTKGSSPRQISVLREDDWAGVLEGLSLGGSVAGRSS